MARSAEEVSSSEELFTEAAAGFAGTVKWVTKPAVSTNNLASFGKSG
ncbi:MULTISPECIES: hypothetical protein [unclassified Chelatococcus]|nr:MULTISPECIES: hypothetical protein [unclassified Chelatococcus]MBS7700401.1 hypothetical protein [Chelatococcus sp. YT9]MBX3556197.1 hypothetical protein [Chelatococcus sp.]